ncbi:hypothetical protein Ct61P_05732 [Colletotrichum tofieldiae]|nr:hypothetical protein Ct61P_05732 [Colletotrichum tofieldiae]
MMLEAAATALSPCKESPVRPPPSPFRPSSHQSKIPRADDLHLPEPPVPPQAWKRFSHPGTVFFPIRWLARRPSIRLRGWSSRGPNPCPTQDDDPNPGHQAKFPQAPSPHSVVPTATALRRDDDRLGTCPWLNPLRKEPIKPPRGNGAPLLPSRIVSPLAHVPCVPIVSSRLLTKPG